MDNVICPICGEKLNVDGKTATCKNRHSFDRAREGYFYLLPPNAKRSASPGDNRDMVSARKRFLSTDSYLPLANRLTELICARFDGGITLLDAGVGTGYYLSQIAAARGHRDEYIGIDISKDAVRIASRALPSSLCAVASVYSLPIASRSVDAAISVFSPFADLELSRVLKSGGVLYAVVPAESHLIELRRALYDNVRPVSAPLLSEALAERSREELRFGFTLDGEENIAALLAMTPYVYRAPKDSVLKVKSCPHMALTADFEIYTFQKQ